MVPSVSYLAFGLLIQLQTERLEPDVLALERIRENIRVAGAACATTPARRHVWVLGGQSEAIIRGPMLLNQPSGKCGAPGGVPQRTQVLIRNLPLTHPRFTGAFYAS